VTARGEVVARAPWAIAGALVAEIAIGVALERRTRRERALEP
jgi:hypothetical protein